MSAVICVRNRAALIGRCVDSVLAAAPSQVLVVDDGSTDGTHQAASRDGVRVVRTSPIGLARARTVGARAAESEHIVYVDSDVVVDPSAFRHLLAEASETGYDAIQARIEPLDAAGTYWQRGEAWRRRVQERPGPSDVLTFQATVLKRDLVLSSGFDPVFSGAGEDHDFFYRATTRGAQLGHSNRAVAFHEDRSTLRAFLRQRIWHGRGMARLLVRYHRTETRARPAAEAVWRHWEWFPFMAVSWVGLIAGVVVEVAYLARHPELRRSLRIPRTLRG